MLEFEDVSVIKTADIDGFTSGKSGILLLKVFHAPSWLAFLVFLKKFFVIMQPVNLFHQRFSFKLLP